MELFDSVVSNQKELVTDKVFRKVLNGFLNELTGRKARLGSSSGISSAFGKDLRIKNRVGHRIRVKQIKYGYENLSSEIVSFKYFVRGYAPLTAILSYNLIRGTRIQLDCERVFPGYLIHEDDEFGNVYQDRFIGAGLPKLVLELERLKSKLE